MLTFSFSPGPYCCVSCLLSVLAAAAAAPAQQYLPMFLGLLLFLAVVGWCAMNVIRASRRQNRELEEAEAAAAAAAKDAKVITWGPPAQAIFKSI